MSVQECHDAFLQALDARILLNWIPDMTIAIEHGTLEVSSDAHIHIMHYVAMQAVQPVQPVADAFISSE